MSRFARPARRRLGALRACAHRRAARWDIGETLFVSRSLKTRLRSGADVPKRRGSARFGAVSIDYAKRTHRDGRRAEPKPRELAPWAFCPTRNPTEIAQNKPNP